MLGSLVMGNDGGTNHRGIRSVTSCAILSVVAKSATIAVAFSASKLSA